MKIKSGVGVVVVAAGESRRMDNLDKIFAPLCGRPLIMHSLKVFDESPLIGCISIVLRADALEKGRQLVEEYGMQTTTVLCVGGDRRQDSVNLGLRVLPPSQWVIVHDGARPCLTSSTIRMGLIEATHTGAAIAAVPIKETVKMIDKDGTIRQTLDRDGLWASQTPQVFKREMLERAHNCVKELVTDDASMVEKLGYSVRVFMGSYNNLKITTPNDLTTAETVMKAQNRL